MYSSVQPVKLYLIETCNKSSSYNAVSYGYKIKVPLGPFLRLHNIASSLQANYLSSSHSHSA